MHHRGMGDDGVALLLEALAELPPIGPWVTEAACRGQGDTFTTYPAGRRTAELIEQTCQSCTVRSACLAFADQHQVDGVWAGEWHSPSTGQVSSLEQRPARSAVTCGTVPGYRRHLRQREVPCDPCRDANNSEARRAKAARRTAA